MKREEADKKETRDGKAQGERWKKGRGRKGRRRVQGEEVGRELYLERMRNGWKDGGRKGKEMR